MIRTVPSEAGDDALRDIVVEWSELLAQERYAEALDIIRVDREHLFGLDPTQYVGRVHYDDVPLSGYRSDLTAQFNIRRVAPDRIMLEFLAVHVM